MRGSGLFQAAVNSTANAAVSEAQQPNVGIVAPPCDYVNGSYVPPPGASICSEPVQWDADTIAMVTTLGVLGLLGLCALLCVCGSRLRRLRDAHDSGIPPAAGCLNRFEASLARLFCRSNPRSSADSAAEATTGDLNSAQGDLLSSSHQDANYRSLDSGNPSDYSAHTP